MRISRAGLVLLLLPAAGLAAKPATAQQRWTITETLRIGSADEGPSLFSDIRGVAVNARGEIFVLDFKAQEIRMFDARGGFLKRVARIGSGPGEIRNANGIISAPNDELWVNDPANGRLSVFSSAGVFLRQHAVSVWGYGYLWDAMVARDGVVHEMILDRRAPRPVNAIRRTRSDGTLLDTLPMPDCATRTGPGRVPVFEGRGRNGAQTMMVVPFMPSPLRTWDAGGFIWCSPQQNYEVLQVALQGGDTLIRVRRDLGSVPVSDAERETAIARIRKAFTGIGATEPDYASIPRVKPPVEQIDVDDGGRLWVRRAATDTTRTHFDVWDSRGNLIATAEAPFRIAPAWHPLIKSDVVYTVVRDEDDVPFVVVGRIVRRG